MDPSDEDEFSDVDLDNDNSQLREAIKTILEEIAKSSEEERKELLDKIREAVDKIDIDVLGLVLNNRDFTQAVTKEIFMQVVQELEDLDLENVTPEIVEEAIAKTIRYIEYTAVQQAFENEVNKGTLNKLGDAFKAFAKVVVLSPLTVLAALIALVIIVARCAELGVIVADKENNFDKLSSESSQDIENALIENVPRGGEFAQELRNERREIIKMLQNKNQQLAVKELIKELINDGIIKDFSEDDMNELMKKGTSTQQEELEPLKGLMDKFQPQIMAIGDTIDDVMKKINEQVEKMKPKAQMNAPGVEQIASTGKEGPGGGNS